MHVREASPPLAPHGSAIDSRVPKGPCASDQGQVTETEKRYGMCPGTCHPLTVIFLVWPPLSGGEFCSSLGTTSNSEEVPCAEREFVTGCLREKKHSTHSEQQQGGAGNGRTKISSHIQSIPAAPPCRAELPGRLHISSCVTMEQDPNKSAHNPLTVRSELTGPLWPVSSSVEQGQWTS